MADGGFERPDLVPEYLQSLQDQLDAVRNRNERLRARVQRLEKDRDQLTDLIPRRRRPTPRPVVATSAPDREIEVPGVGIIPNLDLPTGPIRRSDLKVAVILDEFSRAAFHYEFSATDVPATGWETVLEEAKPDLLLVESAYRGVNGEWGSLIARFGAPSPQLTAVIDWCRSRRIPTVFWSKEDPINFDWFIASASLFDWVLTVDSNKLERYRVRLGNQRIGVLPFAAQPVIHHPPANEQLRTGALAFAGSYYAAKHDERRSQMDMLLDPARDLGLQIFDRMSRLDDSRFAWPEKYRAHIVGSLTYPQVLEAYRRYRAFINVNTVTDSPTMCARRIYELLASGAGVVSGPSAALAGVPVTVVRSREEVPGAVERSVATVAEGKAWVENGNLMSDRVETILELALN